MELLENIKTKMAEIDAKKQELISELRRDFAPMLEPLFKKSNGKITSIGWSQYTPYFNDGDECTFSVHCDELYINGIDYYDIKEVKKSKYVTLTEENINESKEHMASLGYTWLLNKKIGDSGYLPNDNYDDELLKSHDEFKDLLGSIDGEFLKELFGDHSLVTVYNDGRIQTEFYEHD